MTELLTDPIAVDLYIYVIIALLPLSASMLIFQSNPYHALVLRGILGAIAALVYAVLGAADVALTEALMGTMLAITLYAVAVRSSLVLRLGVLKDDADKSVSELAKPSATDLMPNYQFAELIANLRSVFDKRHMRLELVAYSDNQALHRALVNKEVHATCARREDTYTKHNPTFYTATRLPRLYQIMQAELTFPETTLSYVDLPNDTHNPSNHSSDRTSVSLQEVEAEEKPVL